MRQRKTLKKFDRVEIINHAGCRGLRGVVRCVAPDRIAGHLYYAVRVYAANGARFTARFLRSELVTI